MSRRWLSCTARRRLAGAMRVPEGANLTSVSSAEAVAALWVAAAAGAAATVLSASTGWGMSSVLPAVGAAVGFSASGSLSSGPTAPLIASADFEKRLLSTEDDTVAAAKEAAKALGIQCITLNASELASQLAEEAVSSDLRFPALLAAADRLGIQYIATGHHARVETDAEGVSRICPAADPASDESAALAALPQETLARLILPLGEFSPEELDDLAEELKF